MTVTVKVIIAGHTYITILILQKTPREIVLIIMFDTLLCTLYKLSNYNNNHAVLHSFKDDL